MGGERGGVPAPELCEAVAYITNPELCPGGSRKEKS